MSKQKVHNQGLDGVINKVHTLITNQGEWATESHKDNFVHESCCDYYNVCPQCFGFHPFGSIIRCHQNIAITCVTTCWFDGGL
jgi:hypothetical protein